MKNMNLKMFNKLIDSAEGVEVNFKVGKECELNIKGNFMAIAKLYGIVLESQEINSRTNERRDMEEFRNELDELLGKVK